MEDVERASPRRPGSAVLGAALALPVLAIVVVGAGAERPPLGGGGAWTTPLEVGLALVGLGALAALVLVIRHLPGGLPRAEGGASRSRWWLLAGAVAVGALAWLSGVVAREPDGSVGGGELGLVPGLSGDGGEALPATPTAVVAGLVALGLVAALAILVLRRQLAGPSTRGRAAEATAPTARAAHPLPDGPPREVVLAIYAEARRAVIARLGTGEHDPPRALLRRVGGTAAASPLRALTDLYLPVRYGRSPATDEDVVAARHALAELRERLAAIEGV